MQSFVLARARVESYPGVFHELRTMIGAEKTAEMVQWLGGTCLYIPSKHTAEHSITTWLGLELSQKVCAEFGGLSIEIPRMVELKRTERNAQIIADRTDGLSINKIARKYEMTARNIRNIINKHCIKAASHGE